MLRLPVTLAAAGLGGLAFQALGLPAPWLSGALIGVVALVMAGFEPHLPDPLRDLGMFLAGTVTGSAITPEMLRAAARYPISLVMLAITSVAIVIVGRYVLVRFFKWDRISAFFATMPGALSAVIAGVAALGGDMTRVVAVQSFRMFVLVAMLPSIVFVSVTPKGVLDAGVLAAPDFAAVMALGLMVSLVFVRLGVMAPFLLGGMAGAAALHMSDVVHGAPPPLVTAAAMLLVGAYSGSRIAMVDLGYLRSLILPGIASFLVTTLIAAIGALITAWIVGLSPAATLVAFAPGGLEAMVLLGIALGFDPLFVAAHHVARFVALAAIVPFLVRWIKGAD